MNIKLTHSFMFLCIDPDNLLKGCTKFNTFASRLEKQAKTYASQFNPDPESKEFKNNENVYKGAGFEMFCEWLIRSFPYDKRIGITEFKCVDGEEDTGVDGYGIGWNGKPATMQAKYRQADHVLTSNGDNIDRIVTASQNKYGVAVDEHENMLVITCGKEVNWFTNDKMMYGKVRTINRKKIRNLVDGHLLFWRDFLATWKESLPKKAN